MSPSSCSSRKSAVAPLKQPMKFMTKGARLKPHQSKTPASKSPCSSVQKKSVVRLEVHVHSPYPLGGGRAITLDVLVVGDDRAYVLLQLLEQLRVPPPAREDLRRDVQGEVDALADEKPGALADVFTHLLLHGPLLAACRHEGLVDRVDRFRPEVAIVSSLVVPSGQVRHLAEDTKVNLRRVLQQVILVLAADWQYLEGLVFDLLDELVVLHAPTTAEGDALGDENIVRGFPVDVAEVQLGYPEGEQVLAADISQKFRPIQVAPAAGNLLAIGLRVLRFVVVPRELGEELRVQVRVRLGVLHVDEGLLTRAPGRVEARGRERLDLDDAGHAVVLRERAELVERLGVPLGAEGLQLRGVVRELHVAHVPREVLCRHLGELLG
mmetsp:Transcript_9985/g.28618  ORF Transcript_9985/g.28618 Transcript_9985/m.28618 type:complete len:381 (-) Transcript_9985:494-1636(-)